jgi:hypothetical protein
MALTDNLVGYWKFDEASGNAADAVGSATLTNNGTVTFTSGKINNAADLGSSNSSKSLTTSSVAGLAFDTAFTVNLWVNASTLPANNTAAYVWMWGDNATTNKKGGIEIQYYNNAGTPQIYIVRQHNNYGTQNSYFANQTLTIGTWFMLTYTWDLSTMRLYINGNSTPAASGASTITGTNNTNGVGTGLSLGKYLPTSSSWFSGLYDEMGHWTRALSTSEISQLYNSGNGFAYPFSSASTLSARKSLLGVGI